jgi:glycosyltransferase involved in cell wall biosynthesis
MKKKKVLFLVPYPTQGPSARLRVEQFLPYLSRLGIEYSVKPFYSSPFYSILYRRGNTIKKIFHFSASSLRRICDVASAPFYSVIFIHREVFPIGPPVLEFILFMLGRKIIFDYDDAIYLPPQGSSTIVRMLKCPWKTGFIAKYSRALIVGNEFLFGHARATNKNISIIPTCIDTDTYAAGSRSGRETGDGVVIGWIGSHTTQVFLNELKGVFVDLLNRYSNLKIHLIGGRVDDLKHERLIEKEWSLERERQDMEEFDIGIMPMPDTDWTRGKCAFKLILYMSFGIPVVASPVGVNRDIVRDGENGYLVSSSREWEERLSRLIDDGSLRMMMGKNGRALAVREYSLTANAPKFVEVVSSV